MWFHFCVARLKYALTDPDGFACKLWVYLFLIFCKLAVTKASFVLYEISDYGLFTLFDKKSELLRDSRIDETLLKFLYWGLCLF